MAVSGFVAAFREERRGDRLKVRQSFFFNEENVWKKYYNYFFTHKCI